MAKPSSSTRKSPASAAGPWTVTKNYRAPSICKEVKKGTSPIGVSSSHRQRNKTEQPARQGPVTHFLGLPGEGVLAGVSSTSSLPLRLGRQHKQSVLELAELGNIA